MKQAQFLRSNRDSQQSRSCQAEWRPGQRDSLGCHYQQPISRSRKSIDEKSRAVSRILSRGLGGCDSQANPVATVPVSTIEQQETKKGFDGHRVPAACSGLSFLRLGFRIGPLLGPFHHVSGRPLMGGGPYDVSHAVDSTRPDIRELPLRLKRASVSLHQEKSAMGRRFGRQKRAARGEKHSERAGETERDGWRIHGPSGGLRCMTGIT